jgi:hypothetical protein
MFGIRREIIVRVGREPSFIETTSSVGRAEETARLIEEPCRLTIAILQDKSCRIALF